MSELQELIENTGIKVRWIAEKTGISTNTITNWLRPNWNVSKEGAKQLEYVLKKLRKHHKQTEALWTPYDYTALSKKIIKEEVQNEKR
jgi:uncharacterized protein YjcR